jgi:hypothetical protein
VDWRLAGGGRSFSRRCLFGLPCPLVEELHGREHRLMPPQRQRVLRSGGRGHLVSQRRGNRAEPGCCLSSSRGSAPARSSRASFISSSDRTYLPCITGARPAWSLLEIMAVSAGGWTIEADAQVAALEEDRAIELPEALARHCLIQLVREACRYVLPVRPAAGLALLGDVPKVAGPRAMFLFLDRVGDLFGLGRPMPSGAGPVAGSRDCYLLPKCAGARPAQPDEAERLVAAAGFDGFGLITHRDQYLVTAQRYAAGKAHRRGARRMSARGTRRGIKGGRRRRWTTSDS